MARAIEREAREAPLWKLAVQWPAPLPLTQDTARLSELAALCEGWDGRRLRKLV